VKEKYAESPPKKLLHLILHEVKTEKHYHSMKNWELTVQLLAQSLVANHDLSLAGMGHIEPFKGLPEPGNLFTKNQELLESYIKAVKEDPWDYIGDMYMELGLVGPGQNMTPKGVVDMMIKMTYDTENFDARLFTYRSYQRYLPEYLATHGVYPTHLRPMKPPLKTQLDPCVGTGRFLFEASLLYPEAPLVLFGVEINLALYRACLVNMAMMSNHPYSIICADTLRLDVEKSGPASPLWKLGNRWNPPDVSRYYWKPTPPFQRYMQKRK